MERTLLNMASSNDILQHLNRVDQRREQKKNIFPNKTWRKNEWQNFDMKKKTENLRRQ